MTIRAVSAELSDDQFRQIKDLLYQTSGINLKPGKENLVKNRLTNRLRTLQLADFDAYLCYIAEDESRAELITLVDAMTTNKTSFFREQPHFDYISNYLIPAWAAAGRPLRIWSAGCSSGEEPYSLAMHLCEHYPHNDDVRILATDLSDTVLKTAREATYTDAQLADVPARFKHKYFTKGASKDTFQVEAKPRSMVYFASLNLMGQWPMQGPFDLILCRNVMIYFDKATRENLVNRYWQLLTPAGHLFVGHSESLSGIENLFRYVQPAVYRR